ncbi:MAG TPA: hypothetical protein VG895_04065 [Patescibacteria group bacterium]|nr:hypothetical protein [Patescibacteria group bacterium]
MKISFTPKSQDRRIVEAFESYKDIWNKDGYRIISSIEKVTGLKFSKDHLEATIIDGPTSHSHPLQLSCFGIDKGRKRTLMHELGHIILDDNEIDVLADNDEDLSFVNHKLLDLVLFDIFCEFYNGDEEIARQHVERDKEINPQYYSDAWDWALSMNREERQKLFAKARESKRFP